MFASRLEVLEDFEFRLATIDDADALAGLFEIFFSEARYRDRGLVYERPRARAWLERVIASGDCPHIVATSPDNGIVGSISYSLDTRFAPKPLAIMDMIYVLKPFRRSAIGRVLVALMVDTAKGDGAVAFHVPLASGMNEVASLKNLFKHAGFDEIGVILGRRL